MSDSTASEIASRPRSRAWVYARIVVTIGVFGALFWFVPVADLWAAAQRIPPRAFLTCFALIVVSQLLSVSRFLLLLDAYGAERAPRWLESLRLLLVSSFYNTYLPGGLAGDVVRAVAVRDCFGAGGLTKSLAVSLIERVTGLAGMLLLVALVMALAPIAGIESLLPFSLLGLLGAGAALAAVMVGRKLAPRLPRRLRPLAASLPVLTRYRPYFLALGVAFATHLVTAIGYHVIIRALDTDAQLAETLVIVPVALSASYVPATIAGAGTRDAAFVLLYQRVGVSAADALAMSLSVLLCSFLFALFGGIASLLGPYERAR